MSMIMKYVIILHNMCMEERQHMEMPKEEEVYYETAIVGGEVSPMRAGLVWSPKITVVAICSALIVLISDTKRFMDYEAEDKTNKRLLLVKHVWERYG